MPSPNTFVLLVGLAAPKNRHRPSPAVVMDERVSVNALDGAGERHRLASSPPHARASARHNAGRIRLPPAKSE